jgi:hypothetical protein
VTRGTWEPGREARDLGNTSRDERCILRVPASRIAELSIADEYYFGIWPCYLSACLLAVWFSSGSLPASLRTFSAGRLGSEKWDPTMNIHPLMFGRSDDWVVQQNHRWSAGPTNGRPAARNTDPSRGFNFPNLSFSSLLLDRRCAIARSIATENRGRDRNKETAAFPPSSRPRDQIFRRRGAASNEMVNHETGREQGGRGGGEEVGEGGLSREKTRNAEFIDTLKRAFARHNKHVAAHPTRPSIRRASLGEEEKGGSADRATDRVNLR